MYLMKKQISFCVKKVKSVFNENTDQFCVKKIIFEKYRLVFESFKKKKKTKSENADKFVFRENQI